MCIRTAEFFGTGIHEIDKRINITADIFRYGVSNFIGRNHEYTVKAFLQSHFFAGIDTHVGGISRNTHNCIVGKVYKVVKIGAFFFHRKKGRHEFGGAGGVHFFVGILFIKNDTCICIHQNRRIGTDSRTYGPVLHGIGFNRHS